MHHDQIGMLSAEAGQRIALKGVRVVATLAGLMAETRLEQRYRNDTDSHLEIAYTFPLPVEGVLLHFGVEIGGKHYNGQIIPRQEAEEKYEGSIEKGDAAFRLQKLRDGLYNATLGNVKAGEEVVIHITWGEVMAWSGSAMRYRLPTTLAPRYGDPENMQPWQRPVADTTIAYPLSVKVAMLGDLAKASYECPSHRVAFAVVAEGVELSLATDAFMDRDFVLDIRPVGLTSAGMSGEWGDTRAVALNFMPPPVEASGADAGRDTVILIDCSGSMAGESIEHAKEGVGLALRTMGAKDRFAVLGFGSKTQAFDKALQPANRKNLDLAHRFVQNLPDLGGTELSSALTEAMAYAQESPLDILLLTDGDVWNLEDTAEKAKMAGHRLFTVGIGAAVGEDTVRMLADKTGGACELVTPNEAMVERIARHFGRMRQPRIESITLDWGQAALWETRPDKACFAGDSITVFAAFEHTLPVEVLATLRFAGVTETTVVTHLTASSTLADAIVRLAAHARLPTLAESAQSEWAVRYQLVTERTDCLVTVERTADEKTDALPELQIVPQMLAAGWGGTALVREHQAWRTSAVQKTSLSPIDYCCLSSATAICKSRFVTDNELANSGVNRHVISPSFDFSDENQQGMDSFVAQLNQQVDGFIHHDLPATIKVLCKLGLPSILQECLEELLAQGGEERALVLAFLQALTEHSLGQGLSDRFKQKLQKAITGTVVQAVHILTFKALLDGIQKSLEIDY